MTESRLSWYVSRLGAMSADEAAWRFHDEVLHIAWTPRQVRPSAEPRRPVTTKGRPRFVPLVGSQLRDEIPPELRLELVAAADELLAGRGELLGVERKDFAEPDWFFDPTTGRRAPQREYAFRVNPRRVADTVNVKQIWELSRQQHLTVLSAAWFVSGDDSYAEAADRQLRSWWADNTFLSGIHWTSGIELGLRLITWVWVRRLLDGWEGAPRLFEANPEALQQLYWHQLYLDRFQSRGSSSNNHVIAEAAGQLIASCAFPWFARSDRWRARSASLLERELHRNTFPSGLNREQASDYHNFVSELALLAAAESDARGSPLGEPTWSLLVAMLDATAAVLDERGRAPRQGDSDEGRALVVDPPSVDRLASLLGIGAAVVGTAPWWPLAASNASGIFVGALTRRRRTTAPLRQRPSHFADAGLTLLRSEPGALPEIWCRCDGGPHGYLSISAHAHADALSVEVRHGGVDVLADPGTYCYHGEPSWRSYFRSTIAHNTIELAGTDQSVTGGPFLWVRSASTSGVEVGRGDDGRPVRWSAGHDGYERLDPPARHRRAVSLHEVARRIDIVDRVDTSGWHALRMAFHLGPEIHAELDGAVAALSWSVAGAGASARFELPAALDWTAHCGEEEPILGWYSERFGTKVPAVTLIGTGRGRPGGNEFVSSITFSP